MYHDDENCPNCGGPMMEGSCPNCSGDTEESMDMKSGMGDDATGDM